MVAKDGTYTIRACNFDDLATVGTTVYEVADLVNSVGLGEIELME